MMWRWSRRQLGQLWQQVATGPEVAEWHSSWVAQVAERQAASGATSCLPSVQKAN